MISLNSAELTTAYLSDRDVRCPRCAYNLRDQRGSICPECGAVLKLSITLGDRHDTISIIGLVGIAGGFGFFCGVGALGLAGRMLLGADLYDTAIWWSVGVSFVVFSCLLGLWFRQWRLQMMQPAKMHAFYAALCWLIAWGAWAAFGVCYAMA